MMSKTPLKDNTQTSEGSLTDNTFWKLKELSQKHLHQNTLRWTDIWRLNLNWLTSSDTRNSMNPRTSCSELDQVFIFSTALCWVNIPKLYKACQDCKLQHIHITTPWLHKGSSLNWKVQVIVSGWYCTHANYHVHSAVLSAQVTEPLCQFSLRRQPLTN